MQKIKILICILLLAVGFLFNGELYMLYLDNFQESYYQSNFYIENTNKSLNKEIIQEFESAGEKYETEFFVIDRKLESAYETEIIIYGTDKALKYLQTKDIRNGTFNSLFFGQAKVKYKYFSEIDSLSKYNTFYFIGDETEKKNFDLFKASLIDKYGGGFPKLEGSDKETWMNLLSVWSIVFGLALMMTLYNILYQKKEIMVRIILGENLNGIFIKNAIVDTVTFFVLFFLISKLLSSFSCVGFKISFVFILFCIFLVLNILINATILFVDFKKDLADGGGGQGILTSSYVLKVIITILVSLILAGNFVVIKDAYNLYQQKDFFENHKEYSYYQLEYKIDNNLGKTYEDNLFMNQQFYQRFQEKSLQYVDLTENFDSTYPVLLNNKTSIQEIENIYPSIAKAIQKAKEEKIYILLPSNIMPGSQEHTIAIDICNAFFDNAGYDPVESIEYEEGISMVGVHKWNEYKLTLYKNPIILYNNTSFKVNELLTGYDVYYMCDTMYDISEEEWQSFIQEFNVEGQIVSKSNVLDVYKHNWNITLRNMRMIITLSAFLLLLEMSLIVFIIRLEYQFNAIEMALKKIVGYSLYEKNKQIINVTLLSNFIGILAAFIISNILKLQGGYPLILIGILLLLLELCYIFYKAKKIETLTVVEILKGGQL